MSENDALREAAAIGWDACVSALKYEDGTPVEVVTMTNPYRATPPCQKANETVTQLPEVERMQRNAISPILDSWDHGLDVDGAHPMDPTRRLIHELRAALTAAAGGWA